MLVLLPLFSLRRIVIKDLKQYLQSNGIGKSMINADELNFEKLGLIPTAVCDAQTSQVLMPVYEQRSVY